MLLRTLSDQEKVAITVVERRYGREGFGEPPMRDDPFLYEGMSLLPLNGEVIDVGSGLGRAVPLLHKFGIRRYFGFDPSAMSVSYCQRQWPQLHFEVGDIRLLGAQYPNRFDGFLLFAVLPFIPKRDLDKVLASLHACLKPGACGVIINLLGRQGRHMVRGQSGMKFTLLTLEEVMAALGRNGFRTGRYLINPIGEVDEELRMHVVAV